MPPGLRLPTRRSCPGRPAPELPDHLEIGVLSLPGNRNELGKQLRKFREAANLRGSDLGQLLELSQGQISRVETGKRRISPEGVQQWLEATNADSEVIDQLVAAARRFDTEVTAWKEKFGPGWDIYQQSYAGVESAAKSIKAYQVSVIHGLLQTPGYSEFIQREIVGLSDEQVTAGLTAMRNRQRLLYEPETRLEVILTEQVLRHRFPGAAVMVEQLHRIAQLAALPTVNLAVIPTDNDMPLPYMTSFDLFSMPDDEPDLVIIELDTHEVREADPDRLATYERRHHALFTSAQTLTGQAAIDFVQEIAAEMTATIFPNASGQH
ncbi:helix-turn-helix domain-containing protein [Pseudonocardiaceae bacterium YIM PH 21723]|nr:helix-turn-helix domain-containing protein [Pseudonocardiaceae bacterium YIM PH 21723]